MVKWTRRLRGKRRPSYRKRQGGGSHSYRSSKNRHSDEDYLDEESEFSDISSSASDSGSMSSDDEEDELSGDEEDEARDDFDNDGTLGDSTFRRTNKNRDDREEVQQLVTRNQVLDELRAQAAADALGKSLEQMGYNLDNCDSFYSLSDQEEKDQRYEIKQQKSDASMVSSKYRRKSKKGKRIKSKNTATSRRMAASYDDDDDEGDYSTKYGEISTRQNPSFGDYDTYADDTYTEGTETYFEDETSYTTYGKESMFTGKTSRFSKFTKRTGPSRRAGVRRNHKALKRRTRDADTYYTRGTEWTPTESSYGKTIDENSTLSSMSGSDDSELDTMYTSDQKRVRNRGRTGGRRRHMQGGMRAIEEEQEEGIASVTELSDYLAKKMKQKMTPKHANGKTPPPVRHNNSLRSNSSNIIAMRSLDTVSVEDEAKKLRTKVPKSRKTKSDKEVDNGSSDNENDDDINTSPVSEHSEQHNKSKKESEDSDDCCVESDDERGEDGQAGVDKKQSADKKGRKAQRDGTGREKKGSAVIESDPDDEVPEVKQSRKKEVKKSKSKHGKGTEKKKSSGMLSDADEHRAKSKNKEGITTTAKKVKKGAKTKDGTTEANILKSKSNDIAETKQARSKLKAKASKTEQSNKEPSASAKFWPTQLLSLRKNKKKKDKQASEDNDAIEEESDKENGAEIVQNENESEIHHDQAVEGNDDEEVVEDNDDDTEIEADNVSTSKNKSIARGRSQNRIESRGRNASRDSKGKKTRKGKAKRKRSKDKGGNRGRERERSNSRGRSRSRSVSKSRKSTTSISAKDTSSLLGDFFSRNDKISSAKAEESKAASTSDDQKPDMMQMAAMAALIPLAPLAAAYNCYNSERTQSLVKKVNCNEIPACRNEQHFIDTSCSENNVLADRQNSARKETAVYPKPAIRLLQDTSLEQLSEESVKSLKSKKSLKSSTSKKSAKSMKTATDLSAKSGRASKVGAALLERPSHLHRARKTLGILPTREIKIKYNVPKTHIQEAPEGFESFLPELLDSPCINDSATFTSQGFSIIAAAKQPHSSDHVPSKPKRNKRWLSKLGFGGHKKNEDDEGQIVYISADNNPAKDPSNKVNQSTTKQRTPSPQRFNSNGGNGESRLSNRLPHFALKQKSKGGDNFSTVAHKSVAAPDHDAPSLTAHDLKRLHQNEMPPPPHAGLHGCVVPKNDLTLDIDRTLLDLDGKSVLPHRNAATNAARKLPEIERNNYFLSPTSKQDDMNTYDLGETLNDVLQARQTLENAYGNTSSISFDQSMDDQLVDLLTSMADMDQNDMNEVEAAIGKLKRHARKLGISEKDLLFSAKSAEESALMSLAEVISLVGEDEDILDNQDSEQPTFGNRMMEAFENYLKK